MAKRTCCLCNNEILNEDTAPILTLGNSGWPRYVCPECEERIAATTEAKTYEDISDACRTLGDGMIAMRVEDTAVIEEVNEIIKSAMERAEQIKAGTYDFSQDEEVLPENNDAASGEEDGDGNEGAKATEKPEFDIPEELRETEEDRALDEKEARANKVLDTVTSWAAGLILLGAVIFFLVRFVF